MSNLYLLLIEKSFKHIFEVFEKKLRYVLCIVYKKRRRLLS